jgi:hypothetical protein
MEELRKAQEETDRRRREAEAAASYAYYQRMQYEQQQREAQYAADQRERERKERERKDSNLIRTDRETRNVQVCVCERPLMERRNERYKSGSFLFWSTHDYRYVDKRVGTEITTTYRTEARITKFVFMLFLIHLYLFLKNRTYESGRKVVGNWEKVRVYDENERRSY